MMKWVIPFICFCAGGSFGTRSDISARAASSAEAKVASNVWR